MALPTSTDLLALDVGDDGQPFVQVSAGTTDEMGFDGQPFIVAESGAVSDVEGSMLTLPAITGSGATAWSSSAASLTHPTATGTGRSGLVGASDLFIPDIEGDGAGGPAISVPAITGAATALAGTVATSAQDVAVAGEGSANPGITGASSATLPTLTGSGTTPPASLATLPVIAGAASGTSGAMGRSTVILAALDGVATASTPVLGGSEATHLAIRGTGSAITGNVGASSATLASFILAAEGFSGTLGTSALTLPVLTADGAGHVQLVGASTLTLPMIVASGQSTTPVGATYQGYALQTGRRALTTYSNVPIRGLTAFNGVYLAAGPGGLFVLGGDTDGAALIDATARLANTDFGTAQVKRVSEMFVNYRTDGDLTLKVIIDEHEEYDYTLEAAGHDTLSAGRAKIGKGAKGVYWQVEVSNRDGADFELDRLALEPFATSRKLG
jgi:hypothetical protein